MIEPVVQQHFFPKFSSNFEANYITASWANDCKDILTISIGSINKIKTAKYKYIEIHKTIHIKTILYYNIIDHISFRLRYLVARIFLGRIRPILKGRSSQL